MKTKLEKVTGKAQVWALPTMGYEKDLYGDRAFHYEIRTDRSYRKGAVMVSEFEVETIVPEGVDLVMAAVKTLEERIEEIRAEKQREIEELLDEIKKLRMLEYKPDLEVISNDNSS